MEGSLSSISLQSHSPLHLLSPDTPHSLSSSSSYKTLSFKLLTKRGSPSSRLSLVVKSDSSKEMALVDPTVSPRSNSLKLSKTMAITDHATALVQAGVPVIRLAAGEPDFNTPPVIAEEDHTDVATSSEAADGGFGDALDVVAKDLAEISLKEPK
ncbi:hypothetical protein QJS10_CPB12g01248 [Acorus calamus]|uniref:Uncharacterized protein n=1 Tax=Acorus calamus TaxID=4465 RepID=A0AAV9DMS6_ACOCL|nr:hypothetical protein QJS10_CPB12g01248 [Acorus calamus]